LSQRFEKLTALRCSWSELRFGKLTTCIVKTSVNTIKPKALPWARLFRPLGAKTTGQVPPAGGQVLESGILNFELFYPLTLCFSPQ
jgi:hypothetical protein